MFTIIFITTVFILIGKLSFGKCLSVKSNDLHLFHEVHNQKIEELEIKIKNSRSWIINVLKIKGRKDPRILKKNKKKFKAEINFRYKNYTCFFKGKIRLTGDYKDHIQINKNKLISSLKVELKNNGSVYGFTEFKLFNPISRHSENEIIHTTLLRNLDLLAPRTYFVDVKFLDQKFKMIMQEGFAKEVINLARAVKHI